MTSTSCRSCKAEGSSACSAAPTSCVTCKWPRSCRHAGQRRPRRRHSRSATLQLPKREPAPIRVVIALGGNAILRSKELNSYAEQFDNVRRTAQQVVSLIKDGAQVVLTHGNGPQVGNRLIQ